MKTTLAAHNREFRLGILFPGQTGIRDIIGPDICRLLDTQANPCGKHFLLGECKYNACKFAHGLQSAPTAEQIQAVETRVKTRCDEVVADPSKY